VNPISLFVQQSRLSPHCKFRFCAACARSAEIAATA
jgi:hypothetical protein